VGGWLPTQGIPHVRNLSSLPGAVSARYRWEERQREQKCNKKPELEKIKKNMWIREKRALYAFLSD
jgi:hypothetical protein